ncbi:D-alanyl-D-alanine carboxypeptidase/D-alanyl-D-alanine endopeptidase [Corynebacterium sp. H78]|uniref:D-alanyl-D-alanine carboxypeptidase/D-alanyl-D-alanine endopeptidase n=1 Tax=Corynebacterium sp. H78 TaxID=3133417 RepID=UPI0030A67FAA
MSRTAAWIASAIAFCVVVGVVIAFAFVYNSRTLTVEPAPVVAPAAAPLAPVGTPGEEPMLRDDALRPLVAPIMDEAGKNKALGTLHAAVFNGATGGELWESKSRELATPASSMKILTAAAVLLHLDHNKKLTTKVVRYGDSADLYLVGAGDPTLSESGAGFYDDAASLTDLAEKVKKAQGSTPAKVIVDTSLFGETFHEKWDKAGLSDGYVSPIESIQVDAGRKDPTDNNSQRTDKPAEVAGQTLAKLIGASTAEVMKDKPAGEPTVVAEVTSAPLETRVRQMMVHSDNVLAESLARELAIARGLPPTFAGGAKAVRDTLAEHNLGVENSDGGTKADQPAGPGAAVISDSSGLSTDNQLTPRQLVAVLNAAARPLPTNEDGEAIDLSQLPGGLDTVKLRPLLDSLPVAAVSGTLEDRYGNGNPGAGFARAKTGTLDGVSALAGYVVTDGGEVLTFVMLSNEAQLLEARAAADEIVGKLKQIK